MQLKPKNASLLQSSIFTELLITGLESFDQTKHHLKLVNVDVYELHDDRVNDGIKIVSNQSIDQGEVLSWSEVQLAEDLNQNSCF